MPVSAAKSALAGDRLIIAKGMQLRSAQHGGQSCSVGMGLVAKIDQVAAV
jgi:hypothetical protein